MNVTAKFDEDDAGLAKWTLVNDDEAGRPIIDFEQTELPHALSAHQRRERVLNGMRKRFYAAIKAAEARGDVVVTIDCQ